MNSIPRSWRFVYSFWFFFSRMCEASPKYYVFQYLVFSSSNKCSIVGVVVSKHIHLLFKYWSLHVIVFMKPSIPFPPLPVVDSRYECIIVSSLSPHSVSAILVLPVAFPFVLSIVQIFYSCTVCGCIEIPCGFLSTVSDVNRCNEPITTLIKWNECVIYCRVIQKINWFMYSR